MNDQAIRAVLGDRRKRSFKILRCINGDEIYCDANPLCNRNRIRPSTLRGGVGWGIKQRDAGQSRTSFLEDLEHFAVECAPLYAEPCEIGAGPSDARDQAQ